MNKKILYFSLIIIILALIGGVFYFQFFLTKKQAPLEPKSIMESLPKEIREKIEKEQEKIRSIHGKVEKIEGKILFVKVSSEAEREISEKIKDKIYQITVSGTIRQTKIDPKTGIPKTSDFSFEKIKIGDEIIAWSSDDLRGKDKFSTEYAEVLKD